MAAAVIMGVSLNFKHREHNEMNPTGNVRILEVLQGWALMVIKKSSY